MVMKDDFKIFPKQIMVIAEQFRMKLKINFRREIYRY